ncbi:MAG: hypothetical protein D6743_13625 [Calditrichaeota bacterium]|nr:MAG: hypothetical protein D6743_13625 [Calditrichota bacterium]
MSLGTALLLALAPFGGQVLAQKSNKVNSLRDGAWSLQFEIDRDFRLRSFEGTVISAKKHLSKAWAFRFGLGVDISVTDFDQSAVTAIDSVSQTVRRENDADNQRIDLITRFLRYAHPDDRLSFFIGVGPEFGVRLMNNDSSDSTDANRREIVDENSTEWRVGIGGTFGAEWFATRTISFLAEYGVSFSYVRDKTTGTRRTGAVETRSETRLGQWSLRAKAVKFGLSVYF